MRTTLRGRLQLPADLVPRKHCEYSALDGAFLTHCRLRRCGWALAMQWLAAATYPKPPGLTSTKSRLSARFQKLSVYGRALPSTTDRLRHIPCPCPRPHRRGSQVLHPGDAACLNKDASELGFRVLERLTR